VILIKGTTKNKGQKDILDKFYTNEDVAKKIIKKVDDIYKDRNPIYLEPSAGAGAFSKNIKNCISLDIKPEDSSIRKQDFFKYDWKDFKDSDFIITIGNPPFGQNGKTALDFFKKSTEKSDIIAFILPRSFMKDTFINKIPTNYHLINGPRGDILDLNSFNFKENEYSIPTCFQIWERRDNQRKIIKKISFENNIIEFTTKDKADFRIQRVGGNAGKASKDLNRSIQSNYFIKNISNFSNDYLIEKINNLIFPTIEFTTGPKSLSKQELIMTIKEAFSNE
jgi:hypothetical protein